MKKQDFDTKRRSFLKLSGLLGLGVASSAILPAEKAEAVLFGKKEHKVTKTRLAMGTYVSMTAIHHSRDEAEQAIGEAFEEIERLNRLLTRFENVSPVAELNQNGRIEYMGPEVSELIGRSLYYYQQTGGAFDITVKPLIDLYKTSFEANRQPSDKEIAEVLAFTGAEKIQMDGQGLRFARTGMGITLDGIAKGYIVDKASEYLQQKGIENHLVNGGGDIRTSGKAVKGQPWTVAVQDPNKTSNSPEIIELGSGAVATSGNYEVYYDREKLFHHIIDGKSGLSPQLSTSVTVTAATVMDADALSTAVFVMEPTDGIRFIDSQMDCECLVITRNGVIKGSKGWQV